MIAERRRQTRPIPRDERAHRVVAVGEQLPTRVPM
jgi:hypothetical protein